LRRERRNFQRDDETTDILHKGFNMLTRGYLRKVIKVGIHRLPLVVQIKLIEKLVATCAIGSACRVVFWNIGSVFLAVVKLQRGIVSELVSKSLNSRGSRKWSDVIK